MTEEINMRCARWSNLVERSTRRSIGQCIRNHGLRGPGCTGCPDYPKEWDGGQDTDWDIKA
jgi:hypothetical protein